MTPLQTFSALLEHARGAGPCRVAVVDARGGTALEALDAAVRAGFADPVLVGPESAVRRAVDEGGLRALTGARVVDAGAESDSARAATRVARAGEADVLLKGRLRTDQLLGAVLDRDAGLRREGLLSDVLIYEDTLSGETRLVGITDGGITPAPDASALRSIVRNGVVVMELLGISRPRVALLSATEAVTDALPSTGTARAVAEWAAASLPDAAVAGPLALDNALLPAAAAAKGITGEVPGRADLLVAPSIEAGNLLGKAAKYLGGSITAHVVVGAAVPILIPSRVESVRDKLHSIALGVLLARSAVPGGAGASA